MTDKNTPAFPCAKSEYNSSNQYGEPHQLGMTLRDWFAGQALSGDFAAQDLQLGEITNDMSDDWMLKRAQTLYRMADAMMAAREE